MTISMRESATSTSAISSLAHTLSPPAMHGSVVDEPSVAHWNWISGSDADAHRSKVIDRVEWSVHLRQLYAVGTDSSTFPLKTANFTALAGDLCPDLRDALRDLDEARDEAREEGFPAPSDTALGNARRLLHAMYPILPRHFEVYPTPDGEIAIDIPGGLGYSVLLLCGSDGGALCSVNMDGAHRRARYSDTRRLPDNFICDALDELKRSDSAAA